MRARAACGVATPHQIAIGLQKLVCGLRLAGILIRPSWSGLRTGIESFKSNYF